MRRLRTWRPALRIARREALRASGRSLLVLAMIALPVLAVVAADVLGRTADVTTVEGLDRQLGRADARVRWNGDLSPVTQSPTLDAYGTRAGAASSLPVPTGRTVAAVLPGARQITIDEGTVAVRTANGVSRPGALAVDLRRPGTRGLVDLRSGRFPRSADEVAVSPRLAGRGFGVGSTLRYLDGGRATVVGLVEPADATDANLVVGLPGTLPMAALDGPSTGRSWLVTQPGGVSWSEVRALNRQGLQVLSRRVVEHPPPPSRVEMHATQSSLTTSQLAVLAMIVAMALLEVVLLAGPAFAVGARRQERSLALISSTGGTGRDVRRVVLGSGVVLGAAAAVLGAVGGIAVARLAQPLVQRVSNEPFGPFQVVWREVAAIAGIGLLSALLAAVAPAVMASRQDVVAVLAGRRGQTRAPRWSPVVGAVLLGLGVLSAVAGARRTGFGAASIAGSAILAVLGMVLLVPLIVSQLGRGSSRLPLPLRFALRDASRQRGRTAPAVAAVAAVVAGVVALGIGAASDAAENRATYALQAPMGAGVLTSYTPPWKVPDRWIRFEQAVTAALPGARVQTVRGIPDSAPGRTDPEHTQRQLMFEAVGDRAATTVSYSNALGGAVLVGASGLRALGLHLDAADAARARAALTAGGVVLLGNRPSTVTRVRVTSSQFALDGDGETVDLGHWTLPATQVVAPGPAVPALAVVSPAVARAVDFPVLTSSLVVRGVPISQNVEDALVEATQAVDANAQVYVERGFQDSSTAVALLVLGALGAVLVLGGTLTATFLALSDARPDFATMGAVGAGSRTRRLVAASYALSIGAVGAVLGAVVGAVPGVAVTYPLTSTSWLGGGTDAEGNTLPDHFLEIPWLLVAVVVVGLPLLSAAVVAASTRSRLPMVGRLS